MTKNLYEELGLTKNATQGEIKSSYRRLVKKHHPDAGGETDRFLSIQYAWETLNDPYKKEQYDKSLSSFQKSSDFLNVNWEDKVNTKKFSTRKDLSKYLENKIKKIYSSALYKKPAK